MFLATFDYVNPETQDVIVPKGNRFSISYAMYLATTYGFDTFYLENKMRTKPYQYACFQMMQMYLLTQRYNLR